MSSSGAHFLHNFRHVSRLTSCGLLRPAAQICTCSAVSDTADAGTQVQQSSSQHTRSAAEGSGLQQPIFAPQPGTVAPFQHHVFVRTASPDIHGAEACAAWPPVVERQPALSQAFAAVAQHRRHIEGVVRVSAFEGTSPAQLEQDCCDVLIYPSGVRYHNLGIAELTNVVCKHTSNLGNRVKLSKAAEALEEDATDSLQLFVCCHGSRDARCGVIGPPLCAKLQRLVDMRGLHEEVSIAMCSHIGGHKFAGNVLVYGALSPSDGDWFGGLNADNADDFLDALLDLEVGSDGGPADARLRGWWRGRMGYTKQEQLQFFENGIVPASQQAGDSDGEEEGYHGDEHSEETAGSITARGLTRHEL